uniref:WAP domain-containing protein n=1 Tax=Scleropages formosus TaxID=113540 RepID=A0A8C9SZ23_SCLFO
MGSVMGLTLSRTAEFSARPGHCPRNPSGAWGPQCEWDTDCPGFQKCCQGGNFSYCTNPVAAGEKHMVSAAYRERQYTEKCKYAHMHKQGLRVQRLQYVTV